MNKRIVILFLLLILVNSSPAVELEDTYFDKFGIAASIGTAGFGASALLHEHDTELMFSSIGYSAENSIKRSEEQTDARIHFRRFFKDQIGGWYYGGYLQQTKLSGKLKGKPTNVEQRKTGLGADLGYSSYSLFGHRDLYWGVGAGVSVFLGADEQNIFENKDLEGDRSTSFFIDLIRVGAVF